MARKTTPKQQMRFVKWNTLAPLRNATDFLTLTLKYGIVIKGRQEWFRYRLPLWKAPILMRGEKALEKTKGVYYAQLVCEYFVCFVASVSYLRGHRAWNDYDM